MDHLRWDLKQIFRMVVAEEVLSRNPAELLFTPPGCPLPATKIMKIEEVQKLFAVLDIREQLIAKLAVMAGMRPGEIFGLTWSRLEAEYADVRQRVYRGDIDSRKSVHSVRWAALSDGLMEAIREWKQISINTKPDVWVFPSEKGSTPLLKDNCWRGWFAPRLKAVGLGWVNFHVMRKTHSCLLKELDVDPQIRAEQMGHTVDVNQNVYTRSSLARRREAVNRLDYRSLNIDTFNPIYVLMGHALPEEAQSPPVQRAGNAQAGVHAQVSNRGETAHSSGVVSFGFAIRAE